MEIVRKRRESEELSLVVTVAFDGGEIDAKLPREFLDDAIGDSATEEEIEVFIGNNVDEISKAAIAMARASLTKEDVEKLPYFQVVRRPFDGVRFLAIRWKE